MKIYVTGLGVVSGIGLGVAEKYSFTQETSAWYGESHSFPYGTGCTRIRGKNTAMKN